MLSGKAVWFKCILNLHIWSYFTLAIEMNVAAGAGNEPNAVCAQPGSHLSEFRLHLRVAHLTAIRLA